MTKENTIILAIITGVIFASLIIGGSIIATQIQKQGSIERQQIMKIEQQKEENETKKQIAENEANEERCKSLEVGVKRKWSNVIGVFYSENYADCAVTYTDPDTGQVNYAPLSSMQDVK